MIHVVIVYYQKHLKPRLLSKNWNGEMFNVLSGSVKSSSGLRKLVWIVWAVICKRLASSAQSNYTETKQGHQLSVAINCCIFSNNIFDVSDSLSYHKKNESLSKSSWLRVSILFFLIQKHKNSVYQSLLCQPHHYTSTGPSNRSSRECRLIKTIKTHIL